MMGTRDISTKEKLLSLVDDIEYISKELLESTIAPKQDKLSPDDQNQLIQLLLMKNNALKDTFKLAHEQGEIEEKMEELEAEVNHYDQDIQTLQKHLKDAEVLLSTALYQAKQKLDQMIKAQEHCTSSEELVRFAHRISATHAVAAPLNWLPGDPRRPYPTDLEMRMGFLGKLGELPGSAPPSLLLDSLNSPHLGTNNTGGGGPFPPWHPQAQQQSFSTSGNLTPDAMMSNLGMTSGFYHHPPQSSPTLGVDPSTRNHKDVEVMSSDSSSSSSSDSQ